MAGFHLPFGRRVSAVVLWAIGGVVLVALAVEATHTGIDVLALMVLVLLLVLVERTVGDWVAEVLGPTMATVVFASAAALAVFYLLGDGGQARARRALSAAEERGYRGLFLNSQDKPREKTPEELEAERREKAAAETAAAAKETANRQGEAAGSGDSVPAGGAAKASADTAQEEAVVKGEPTGNPVYRRRTPELPRIALISMTPRTATIGRAAVLTARVVPAPEESLSVSFTVNGRDLATVPVKAGEANVQFETDIAGVYTVRARITGPGRYSTAESSTVVNVLPARQ